MSGMKQYERDVFISHHPDNRAWAEGVLLPRLEAARLRVVIESRDFEPGLPQVTNIENAINSCRHTLLVISQGWLRSGWNEFEGLLLQSADPAGRTRRLIPVLIEPCQLPPRLGMLNHVDFTGSEVQDPEEMQRLLRGLVTKSRVFLCYAVAHSARRGPSRALPAVLEDEGHRVTTDQDIPIGLDTRRGVHEAIGRSDFVVALLSTASVSDGAFLDQVGEALEILKGGDKGHLLPVRVNYLDALPEPIRAGVDQLCYALWHDEGDDESVARRLLDAISRFTELHPEVTRVDEHAPVAPARGGRLRPSGGVLPIAFLDGAPTLQQPGSSWAVQAIDALTIPKDQPTVNFGWLRHDSPYEEIRRVVLHEFGHVLGLVHEHQIPGARNPLEPGCRCSGPLGAPAKLDSPADRAVSVPDLPAGDLPDRQGG